MSSISPIHVIAYYYKQERAPYAKSSWIASLQTMEAEAEAEVSH